MNLLETIELLTSLRCGSGFEGEMAALMSKKLARLGARVQIDRMGNVSGRFGPENSKQRVMVCSHMDEVSLIVKYIDEEGMVFFDPVGTVNPAVLQATSVDICTGEGIVPGVISARSRHLLSPDEMALAPKVEDLWIETGAGSASEARLLGIQIGDNVVFRPNFRPLANGYFSSKSIDNRTGCAILLHLAEGLQSHSLDYQLYLSACVQEEVGARGAGVAARAINPDLAVVVDTLPAAEPLVPARRAAARLGRGPVLRAMDILPTFLGTLYAPRIRRRLVLTAEQLGMAYQVDVAQTWTDAAAIHREGQGIPTAGIFVPRHGSHSPVEVACLSDVEGALRLVEAFLTGLDAGGIEELVAPPGSGPNA